MIGIYFFFGFMNLGFNKKNTKYTKIKCPFWSKITTKNEIIFNHRIVSSYQKDIEYDDSKLLWVFTVCMCVVYQNKVSNWISAFFISIYREYICAFLWWYWCVCVCEIVWSCFPNQQINYRYMALGATFWPNQINIILNIKSFIQINLNS